jgi:hypothetical protein
LTNAIGRNRPEPDYAGLQLTLTTFGPLPVVKVDRRSIGG